MLARTSPDRRRRGYGKATGPRATGTASAARLGDLDRDFYKTKVDVCVPAALEQMIKVQEARWLDCKVVAEGANAPTTPAGDRILNDRGIEVIPAILANAGGVTVSYFEWVQNKSCTKWSEERVDRELNAHMVDAAHRTKKMRQKYGTDMRTAAYMAALQNVAKVYEVRGIFP
jgi:glutamate dehydrogenase (NAD(P)+)